MTNDALLVLNTLFRSIFSLFTSWYIPGTNVTPAVAFFGILFISILFRVLSRVLGLWDDGKGDSK